jgi:hypothetical protein
LSREGGREAALVVLGSVYPDEPGSGAVSKSYPRNEALAFGLSQGGEIADVSLKP